MGAAEVRVDRADAELPEGLRLRCDALQRSFDDEVRSVTVARSTFSQPDEYVAEVLPTEIERLRQGGSPPDDVELLVLLCGTSPQPLLVSARFVSPPRVMLVGSDTQPGQYAVGVVDALLRKLDRQHGKGTGYDAPVYIHPHDPVRAYRKLADAIRARGIAPGRVLVDVTGGKKTMVAAAFLVCSELGVRSAYVDAEYDARARMPRPCTSDFQLLDDPVAAFRMRDLRRVIQLTRASMYGAARELLAELVQLDLAVPGEVLRADLQRLAQLDAWAGRRMESLVGAPEPIASLARDWAKHAAGKGWSLARCAQIDKGALLARFALHRIVHATRLYRRGRAHEGFLIAFAACDALADGLVTVLLTHRLLEHAGARSYEQLKDKVSGKVLTDILCDGNTPALPADVVVAGSWKGVGRSVFEAALGHRRIRPVRNTLMHNIGEVDDGVIESYFAEDAPGKLVGAMAHALGRQTFELSAESARIDKAIDALEDLEIRKHVGELHDS